MAASLHLRVYSKSRGRAGDFDLFINDVHQGCYFDYSKQRMDGNLAFSGSQDSGKVTCKFENSWVWTLG
jgi:hypothetical protein